MFGPGWQCLALCRCLWVQVGPVTNAIQCAECYSLLFGALTTYQADKTLELMAYRTPLPTPKYLHRRCLGLIQPLLLAESNSSQAGEGYWSSVATALEEELARIREEAKRASTGQALRNCGYFHSTHPGTSRQRQDPCRSTRRGQSPGCTKYARDQSQVIQNFLSKYSKCQTVKLWSIPSQYIVWGS